MEDEALIKKRYSIPYELFGEAFTVFQKKFVFPKNWLMTGLLLLLAVGNILNIILYNLLYFKSILHNIHYRYITNSSINRVKANKNNTATK